MFAKDLWLQILVFIITGLLQIPLTALSRLVLGS